MKKQGWTKPHELTAGSWGKYLSDANIDKLGKLVVSYMKATRIYEFRTELNPARREELKRAILEDLDRLLKLHGWVFVPFHIRFHWTTAIFEGRSLKEATAVIYDSAPRPMHKEDANMIFGALGLPEPLYLCHYRQPVMSDECGLHPFLLAIWRKYRGKLRKHQFDKLEVVSLKAWRDILGRYGNDAIPWSTELEVELLEAIPGKFEKLAAKARKTLEEERSQASKTEGGQDTTNPGANCFKEEEPTVRHELKHTKEFKNQQQPRPSGVNGVPSGSGVLPPPPPRGGSGVPPPPPPGPVSYGDCSYCSKEVFERARCKTCQSACHTKCLVSVRNDPYSSNSVGECRACRMRTETISKRSQQRPPPSEPSGGAAEPRQQRPRSKVCPGCNKTVPQVNEDGECASCAQDREDQVEQPSAKRPDDVWATAEVPTVSKRIRNYDVEGYQGDKNKYDPLDDWPLSQEELLPPGHDFSRQMVKAINTMFRERKFETEAAGSSEEPKQVIRLFSQILRNNDHFMEHARKVANSSRLQTDRTFRASEFECAQRGKMLTARLIDSVLEPYASKLGGNWKVIPSQLFYNFAKSGDDSDIRALIQGDHKIAFVMPLVQDLHFVEVTYQDGKIRVKDSNFNPRAVDALGELAISNDMANNLGRFKHLLQSNGRHVKKTVDFIKCSRQLPGSNDCGPESIVNLLMDTSETSDRNKIAFCRPVLIDALAFYKKNPGPTKTFEIKFLSEGPCCNKARPGHQQFKEPFIQDWCHEHHPVMRECAHLDPKNKCEAPTSRNRGPCQLTNINCFGIKSCWVHCSPADRQRLRQEVHNRWSPPKPNGLKPAQAPTPQKQKASSEADDVLNEMFDNSAPTSTRRARSHEDLRAFLLLVNARSAHEEEVVFEIDYLDGAYGDTRVLCRQDKKPTRKKAGKVKVLLKYCQKHEGWHRPAEEITLDTPDPLHTYYDFAMSAMPSTAELDELAPDCGDHENDEGSDFGDLDDDKGHRVHLAHQMEPINCDQDKAPPEAWTVKMFKEYHIYSNKSEAKIHNIVWESLSLSTRKNHIKILREIQALPPSMNDVPMNRAVVDMVMQKATRKRWMWSTASSYLSTCASACRDLHLYSTCVRGFDLRKDTYFQAANIQAQRNARKTALKPVKSAPLTLEEFSRLEKELKSGTDAWYLLNLTWYMAGRIGDVRRIRPEHVICHLEDEDANGYVKVQARFMEGKGAYFWDPYTIMTSMPRKIAQQLQTYVREHRSGAYLFTEAQQRVVSKAITKLFPGTHSVRSIRRGRLVTLADAGVTDETLKVLSGHKKMETLHRYLGFGHKSSDAAAAASKIASAEHSAAVRGAGPTDSKGMWVGRHSGLRGHKGQRVQAPPTLFGKTAPTREECGLSPNEEDTTDWHVHVHKFQQNLQYDALCKDKELSPEVREAMGKANGYRTTTDKYGDLKPLTADQIPNCKWHTHAVREMLEKELLSPLPKNEPILSACKGFLVDEPHKQRWRIITEPLFNQTLNKDGLPELSYPSGREVAAHLASKKFAIQFDFKGWYYQIELGNNKSAYVVKTKEMVEWEGEMTNLFVFNKLPMGGSHSAHVAQTATWAICDPIMKMKNIFLATMIDNVVIASDDEDQFVNAIETFLKRCDKFHATLNDREDKISKWEHSRDGILKAGAKYAKGPSKFLGVMYGEGRVSNSEQNVKKLDEAFQRLQAAQQSNNITVTRRQLASIISLSAWMAYNVQIPLNMHPRVLKQFTTLESKPDAWDAEVKITPAILNALHPLVAQLTANRPVVPFLPQLPSLKNEDYDIVIIVDAYINGWGGYVNVNGKVFRVKAGWGRGVKHSAWAEPKAASEILRFAKSKFFEQHDRNVRPSVAIVTDHEAMPGRQRRPLSGRGGFSPAYFLNKFFCDLYGDDGLNIAQVFYVEGIRNIADRVSREPELTTPLDWKPVEDMSFPRLTDFFHPYLHPKVRAPWNK